MVGLRQVTGFHHDVDEFGRPLSAEEREKLIAPYLPESLSEDSSSEPWKKVRKGGKGKSFRHLAQSTVYLFAFTVIHFIFSIYIRFRRAYRNVRGRILGLVYYHHRTPELIQRDVKGLAKLPRHLSIILDLPENEQQGAAPEALFHDVCECAAWAACAGIPILSIYERTGVLKSLLPQLHRHISSTMAAYFGPDGPAKPTISLRAPHMPSFSPPSMSLESDYSSSTTQSRPHLSILLLSASDGRHTLVDLTKTLAEMSQKAKLAPEDISTELIDAEITDSVMEEPDLVMLFGDSVVLQGYPPWQIRLSEIFHVPDNNGVGYQVFLQGLYKYANARMRFGS